MDPWQALFQQIHDRLERAEKKIIKHCADIATIKASSGKKTPDQSDKLYYIYAILLAAYVLHSVNPELLKAIMPLLKVLV